MNDSSFSLDDSALTFDVGAVKAAGRSNPDELTDDPEVGEEESLAKNIIEQV